VLSAASQHADITDAAIIQEEKEMRQLEPASIISSGEGWKPRINAQTNQR